ncbi:MAG: lysylphosphatidylglycerol synthase transmembrane domain-containing protein [Desulfobacteraceae bacterium]
MLEQKRKYVELILGIGVTIFCLWLAVPGSDLTSKWEGLKATATALESAEYEWLFPLMALLTLFYVTKAYRWATLLHPIHNFRTNQVIPATMIGFMGNNILPAHLGELLRMYVLSRTHMLSKTSVLASIILERVLDAIAITILFTITSLTLELPKMYELGGLIGATGVVLTLVCLILYAYRTEMVLRFWDRRFRFLPEKFHHKVARMITAGSHGMDILRSPGRIVSTVLFSIFHWSLLAFYIYIVFWAFSINLPFSGALLVLCGTMVAVMIPSAPGFWGVVQAVFTVALTPLGVPQELALAASVYYLASQYVPTTVTGLIFLGFTGFRLGELKSHAEAATFHADV